MDHEALQIILGPEIHLGIHWTEFLQVHSASEASTQDFIAYLFENKVISFKQLELIHQAEPVTISEAGQLQAHLVEQAIQSKLYNVIAPLGQGAMGIVHLAKDRSLLREVALKSLLAPEQGMPQSVIRRFLNEVQITAQLDHPQIIPIYHLSATDSGMPAYTMKCIAGKTFKELISEARQQLKQGCLDDAHQQSTLLDHFLKVCDAMAYAHSRSVIHRDLKPANLMVGPHGDVYVMDWGIAKRVQDPDANQEDILIDPLTEGDPDATQMGQILGTPRYMSPQQAAAKNDLLDQRSDLFALGLILFEILCLSPAFTAKTQIDLLKKVLKAELNPMLSPGKGWPVSGAMRAIVAKATTKKTPPRYGRVEDFAVDIRRSINDQPVTVYQEPLIYRSLRTARKHGRMTLFSVLALATTLMVLTGVSLVLQVHASQATARHEAQLAKLLATGGAKAQAIDSAFLKIQNQLNGLAASAQAQLQQAPQKKDSTKSALFWNDDYASRPPADSRFSIYYDRSVSLHEGVFKAAPGLTQTQLAVDAQQIYPLKHQVYAIFRNNLEPGLSPTEFEKQWLEKGSLIDWAYIALASGLHYAFPGKGGYPADYDPRKRPWYQAATNQKGSFWGLPYQDISGLGMILPCLQALHNPTGGLIGVVGLELRLTRVLEQFLNFPEQQSVQYLYLADQTGQVILDSKQGESSIQSGKQTQPLPDPLVQQMLQKSNGVFESEQELWIYYRINALNWFYILKVDPRLLFSNKPKH